MIFTIRSSRPSRSQTERNMPSDTQPATFAQPARPVSGWYPLKPKHGPVKKFVGILIFTLIWNGIVAIPCYKIVQGFQSGKPDWFLTLFIGGLFVPFGLLFLAISFHQFLAMFNPRVELEVTDLVLKPGGTLSIRWKTRGWVKVIRTLGFVLEGVETTYSKDASGKTRIRRGKPFAQLASPVFERTTDLSRGQCEIIIPEDAKPTVLEGDQKIEWQLKTCGDIAFWPDISDEYEVRVEGAKVR